MPVEVVASRVMDRSIERLGAIVLVLLTAGCATYEVDLPEQRPDWVDRGGRTARFPDQRYVTGHGRAPRDEGIEAAKQRAAADLASQLEVRIEHELRDVSAERDGRYSYELAAMTRTTVDLRLSGLHYETWRDRRAVQALAILERAQAARERRAQRARAVVALRECMAAGERHEAGGRAATAVSTYESCRRPIAEGLEHGAVVGALVGASAADQQVHLELAAASRLVDERVASILESPARNVGEAADALAIQLARQGVSTRRALTVRPFLLGTADLSSAFGRQMGIELEGALARHASGDGDGGTGVLIVHGVYVDGPESVRLSATVKEARTARLVASASTVLPRSAIPRRLELRPSNFVEALEAQKALSDGGLVTGDLRVELWTTRGKRGVVFTEGESYQVYLRVNRPAWVRLVYVLQGGEQVPVDHGFRIAGDRVGEAVRYPETFEVIPPFGVEHFHVTAFTERPAPLATRRQVIAGETYEVVAQGLAGIVRTRGIRRRNDAEVAESFVAITTTPRVPR